MSEEQTQNFRNENPILQQILTKLDVMDTRLQFVETKTSERSYDTNPIWERALAEIMELKGEVVEVKREVADVKREVADVKREVADVKRELVIVNRKFDVFSKDMLALRAEQLRADDRLNQLEA